ncbi:NAD(P)/FAD-dependent oxidoreductase [Lachnoclostridium sp. Marseille-P6806]|uniref:NAD(P)/FAD-dependent oxidoreductase n=1 Tax=Lachnoclostridium sp. Marseille-P6806 TaxID=2364793 RepID=UPI001030AE61|nr:FAD-dependent oxidoreductase [Lachnoclostridium sp. Marseille-P6806]
MTADREVKIAIIGGGPAGLAAAVSAAESGVSPEDILIIERDHVPGGILNQCIHNGFGLHTFREELTGPEYAGRFVDMAKERGIPFLLDTMAVDISRGETAGAAGKELKYLSVMNREDGFFTIGASAVVLAMGCRERPRGALNIPGFRPAGIYTAGTAQRFVNIEGRMPGREAVILGSGDIGLIMARRMTLEGAKVRAVVELMPYSGGLKRNIVQCLDDFGIPLKLSHTVVDIRGRERVEAVTIAEVGPDRRPIPGTEETFACDTLLLSCGLIPENELSHGLGVELSGVTGGPVVNESLETNIPGVFACGNVLHVHDLVDYVSEEAGTAGRCSAAYVMNPAESRGGRTVSVRCRYGVRYTVPASIRTEYMAERQIIRFRVGAVYRDACVAVDFDGKAFRRQKKRILAPGEMEQVVLGKSDMEAAGVSEITIRIEEEPQGTRQGV